MTLKLKRFLLKYDPPGIGLEVEDAEGELDVVHKTLCSAEQVTSEMDILALVEELCASEPELLNARKHRGALLQLLGRLYQVEAFGGPARPSEAKKEAASSSPSKQDVRSGSKGSKDVTAAGGSRIQEGSQVVLIGLQGKLQIFNGQCATVVKMKPDKGKYEVLITEARGQQENLKLKGFEHMLSISNASQPFAIGTCVVICHLRNHLDLNGSIGRVVDIHDQGARYEVRTADSGQLYRVKGDNVVPVEASEVVNLLGKENSEPGSNQVGGSVSSTSGQFSSPARSRKDENEFSAADKKVELLEPGAIVEIVGLRDNKTFNGMQAKVIAVERDLMRYEVKMLGDDSIKKLKAENARLIAFAPSGMLPPQPGPLESGKHSRSFPSLRR